MHVRLRDLVHRRLEPLRLPLLARAGLLVPPETRIEPPQPALLLLGLEPATTGLARRRGGVGKQPCPCLPELFERLAVAERELPRVLARLRQLAEPEDPLEDLRPVGGRRLEERLEAALRQD